MVKSTAFLGSGLRSYWTESGDTERPCGVSFRRDGEAPLSSLRLKSKDASVRAHSVDRGWISNKMLYGAIFSSLLSQEFKPLSQDSLLGISASLHAAFISSSTWWWPGNCHSFRATFFPSANPKGKSGSFPQLSSESQSSFKCQTATHGSRAACPKALP